MNGFYTRRLASPGAILAPMAGFTDAPFREIASSMGALWTVSEMMSAAGVVTEATTRRHGRDVTLDLGRPFEGERDRVIQLFGADADVLADACRHVERLHAPIAIDLNLGCPVPKMKGRGGSCLLQTPEVAAHLVQAMRRAASCDVSAKMRLGWDADRSVEIALALQEAGAALISVHGRTAAQRYEGEANWDAIANVAAHLSIPVIGSGDVTRASQVAEKKRLGVAGVMIARSAVGNPWIFREASGGAAPTNEERAKVALMHAERAAAFYGERTGIRALRKVLAKYLPHLREELVRVETVDDVRRVVTFASSRTTAQPAA
ncbi:tRNA dihydrouridine synthase [Deinococcus yavapaiensis]|uniref:tRNA-dihydrouridine synthase n=1 Tax=Deinococcus yavapaiensis KR-236 TaxID=694435 RepID=A0A318S727_9DEIO|nr:tRNA-dihydrouridine synthase family protein [Deinococcus yavapaiensis]PYE54564.1 nifR3 family TIM-barrel protein [Deinococcus yavapaiensis KR-236]